MSMPLRGPDDRGYEPAGYPAPRGDLPPRPPSPGAQVGRATSVEVRQEGHYASSNASVELTVLAFRLAVPGNPQPLDVLLRGRSLSGTVRDGDWIEVAGAPNDGGRWNVASVQNLTTGATVLVKGARTSTAARVVVGVVLGVTLLIALILIIGIIAALAS